MQRRRRRPNGRHPIYVCRCGRGPGTELVGLTLQHAAIVDRDAAGDGGRLGSALSLLDDVRQLVTEELLSAATLRIVLTRSKKDVRPVGKRDRAGGCGFGSFMDPHRREVGAERPFHFSAHSIGQWLPAAPTFESRM